MSSQVKATLSGTAMDTITAMTGTQITQTTDPRIAILISYIQAAGATLRRIVMDGLTATRLQAMVIQTSRAALIQVKRVAIQVNSNKEVSIGKTCVISMVPL